MSDTQHNADKEQPVHSAHRFYMNSGPQINERLESFWLILGQQGVLRFDQAQRVLGRMSPEPHKMKQPGILSMERTRKLLRPWIDEGVLCYRAYFVRQKGVFWLTSKGYKYAKLNLRYYEPTPSSLPHLYAVNEIRLHLEARYPNNVWKSERELRAEQGAQQKEHLPDAEFLDGQRITALEIMLNVRSETRLQDMLHALATNNRYHAVWYFVSKPVFASLTQALNKLSVEQQKHFIIYDLEARPYKL